MSTTRKAKEYKPKPSRNGIMVCDQKHTWLVVDQNPEREVVPCPTCGALTSVNRLEKQ